MRETFAKLYPDPEKIVEFIKRRGGGVTFVELENQFNISGDFSWGFAERNIWFWMSLSEEAIEILDGLVKKNRIKLTPTTFFVYTFDGRLPMAPIAKRTTKYKKPHWLPVVFNLESKTAA